MVFPFPTRRSGSLPYWAASQNYSLLRASRTLPTVLWTSMLALRDSADTFPPLKSAVGGVIALCDIAEILDAIADAVPDCSVIPPPMLRSIKKFSAHFGTRLLDEIKCSMEAITLTGRISRGAPQSERVHTIGHQVPLDDAYRDFLVQTQLAIQQTHLATQQAQIHLDARTVSAETTHLLVYARVALQ
ncbi:hypothetical protein B0H13DRAFT_2069604 [Mycena leptocephala]|nr:hypothetical protein B0H13DRAFT_2069604 [Mycena leptocephala]